MKTLWKLLDEDFDSEVNNSQGPETFIDSLKDYIKKSKEVAKQCLKYAEEMENIDKDDHTIIQECSIFNSLQEIFDYILETGETDFYKEIKDKKCYADLWSVYSYKLQKEVENILDEYSNKFFYSIYDYNEE